SESKDTFIDFFHDKFKNIEAFLEPERPKDLPNWGSIVQDIRRHAGGHIHVSLGTIDLKHIRGNQARESADLIESWFTVKQTGRLQHADYLEKIIGCLGFSDVSVTITKQGKCVWADVKVKPIADRRICPVVAYGSASYGLYRVLCLWSRPSEDEILNEVGDTSVGNPVIVFHFGRLTEKKRRSLASLCWQRRRIFLTVDDMLILYLCGEKQSRLPAMFACTLPFTFIEPYITTSGLVPPEVFYGRERERDSVLNPLGSCFIYGGRQLGKTALLRDVERRFHSPDNGRIAVWIDMKTSGIGWDRSIDDIWSLITAEFKKYNVIPSSMPVSAGIITILQHIKNWLEEDKARRVLLLLDEADRFLESDGKPERVGEGESAPFARAALLKGLMDQTERRFKVVFAGLHNVQRTTKVSDHPLAHYGEPICIGPLLDHGDRREAYALVFEPLSQCGFRFEPRDLIMRILSQTNFYPSLIQLYCSQVLRHINDPRVRVFNPDESPPYILKSGHVEGAYQSQGLRKAIRDRFIWTLQLDKRYEVIAYSIAYGCLLNRESGLNQGFPVNWIKEQVLEHWSEGFSSQHTDIPLEFLLEEMVGLGLLREIKHENTDKSYTLRNANVLLLIGTEEEILTQLAAPRERDPDYEAATFRSVYRGTDQAVDYSKRNPLTAIQERELRHPNPLESGVIVIVSSSISGLDDLKDFIKAGGPEFFIDADGCINNEEFLKKLHKLSNRQQNGTTILYVSHKCPWNRKWVEESVNKTKRMKSRERLSQVVFVADALKTWQIQDDLDQHLFSQISLISLQPWHDSMLRQWLDDCHYQSGKEYRDQILKVTGNWPGLLAEFHRRAKSDQHQWKKHLDSIHTEMNSGNLRREWLEKFGLSNEDDVWTVVHEMASYGDPITPEELYDLLEKPLPLPDIIRIIRWAEMLSIVYLDKGGYRINSVVANLIKKP
ncbi:MAG: hypothetical protein BWK80_59735, partial [Desulfobacteraceae bacterium IS3]